MNVLKVVCVAALCSLVMGCSTIKEFKPAENVKALRAVNAAELNLKVSKKLKVEADKRAVCAEQRVTHAEGKLEEAKANFETIYAK